MPYIYLQIISIILMLVGVLGVILPALPGILLMFVVALALAVYDGFQHITTVNLIILGVISLASLAIDYLSGLVGGRYFGATRKGIIGGLIGMVLGTIFFAPVGTFLGLFLGILIAEIIAGMDQKKQLGLLQGGL